MSYILDYIFVNLYEICVLVEQKSSRKQIFLFDLVYSCGKKLIIAVEKEYVKQHSNKLFLHGIIIIKGYHI